MITTCPRGDSLGTYMPAITGELVLGAAVTGRADRWIRWTTTGCVALLALSAGDELGQRRGCLRVTSRVHALRLPLPFSGQVLL